MTARRLATLLAASVITASAWAQPTATFSINNLSYDGLGDPDNDVEFIDVASLFGQTSGTEVTITGIGWDVNIFSFAPSWISEVTIAFDDPDDFANSIHLAPGIGDDSPGSGSHFSSIVDLTDNGMPDLVLNSGVLMLEFYESLVDDPDFAEATISGSITLRVEEFAPQPCSGADLAEPFGVLDLADLVAFIEYFTARDPRADLAEPFGVWDLADLVAFVQLFGQGCP